MKKSQDSFLKSVIKGVMDIFVYAVAVFVTMFSISTIFRGITESSLWLGFVGTVILAGCILIYIKMNKREQQCFTVMYLMVSIMIGALFPLQYDMSYSIFTYMREMQTISFILVGGLILGVRELMRSCNR